MTPDTCKHLNSEIQWDKGQICKLKAEDELANNEIAAKHNEMGIGGSFEINEICPFESYEERRKCPWFEK